MPDPEDGSGLRIRGDRLANARTGLELIKLSEDKRDPGQKPQESAAHFSRRIHIPGRHSAVAIFLFQEYSPQLPEEKQKNTRKNCCFFLF